MITFKNAAPIIKKLRMTSLRLEETPLVTKVKEPIQVNTSIAFMRCSNLTRRVKDSKSSKSNKLKNGRFSMCKIRLFWAIFTTFLVG